MASDSMLPATDKVDRFDERHYHSDRNGFSSLSRMSSICQREWCCRHPLLSRRDHLTAHFAEPGCFCILEDGMHA